MLRRRPVIFHNDAMSNGDQDDYQPSVGAVHGVVGVTLFVLGGFALANTNENEMFGVLGLVAVASGLYATVAGAVARGIQLARK